MQKLSSMQMNEATLFGHAKVRDLSGSTDDMNRTYT